MTNPETILDDLTSSLQFADLRPEDGATVALAKRYARLLDEAAQIAAEARTVEPEDEGQEKRLQAVEAAVEALRVTSDLGPKFLAALTSLRMNPAGRLNRKGANDVGVAGSPKLDELRARRAARQNRAASLDQAAP